MTQTSLPPVQHRCGICGEVFESVEALQAHEKTHQQQEAKGTPPKSETRRKTSRRGSNVSDVTEGRPRRGPAAKGKRSNKNRSSS